MIKYSEYMLLLKSGMFWEFYPELTGDYKKDMEILANKKSAKDKIKKTKVTN